VGRSDIESSLEPRSGAQQREASQQTADFCTEEAGIQTAASERPTSRHRASQCPDASDPRFCRLDVGTATDIRTVVDSFTAMDIARDGLQTALSPRAPAALSEQLMLGVTAGIAEVEHHAANVSLPALALESKAVGAAAGVSSGSRKEAGQSMAATDMSVQTEQPATPSTVSTSDLPVDAVVAMVVRQLVTSTGPPQPLQPRTGTAAAQTDVTEATVPADGLGAAQRACSSADTSAPTMQTGAVGGGGEPADCLQISGPSAVPAAAHQLTLSDMEAASEQHPRHRQEPAAPAPVSDSSGISPGNPSPAAAASPVPSTTVPVPLHDSAPSIPGTPRRNIHRRLWRSGRTSEWADLFPCTAVDDRDSRAQSCSHASSDPDSDILRDDSACCTSTTTSSDSMSGSTSSHDDTSASPVPLLRTAACQTSDAAVSVSTTDDSDLCILSDSSTEAC